MNEVFQINRESLALISEYYSDFAVSSPEEHILYLFKAPDLTVTVFKSLKVMLQGKAARDEYLMWADMLGFDPLPQTLPQTNDSPKEKVLYSIKDNQKRIIGSDEVGTGDFFGPVVVASALVCPKDLPLIDSLSIRDSKKMSDEAILKAGDELVKAIPNIVLVVSDEKYNSLVEEGYNLNKMKAYLHNHAIRKLASLHPDGYDQVVVDEFCPENAFYAYLEGQKVYRGITFRQRAESSYAAVAAASVLARRAFLLAMEDLNTSIGINLPFGASVAVDMVGKRIALEKGFPIFRQIAKLNFKNMQKIHDLMDK